MDQLIQIDINQAFENNSGAVTRVCALLLMTAEIYEELGRTAEADTLTDVSAVLMGIHEAITGVPTDTFREQMMTQAYAIGKESVALSVKH